VKRKTRARTIESSEFRAAYVPRGTAFLQGLKPREIDVVLAAARLRRFSAKRVMTYQGEPADGVMLSWKGRARYFFDTPNGEKLILRWITPGDVFGLSTLLSRRSTYVVSAEAVRDSAVLMWPGETIRALVRRFPAIWENALFIAESISIGMWPPTPLTSQSARERLTHVLVELAPRIGQEFSGNIELEVTNEELANSANITPYTTSRLMSEWRRSGAIRKRYGKIFLHFPRWTVPSRNLPEPNTVDDRGFPENA
jgi:CRP-like cAMP-binding protein